MEAMLGISLYGYPQLAKTLCLSYYAYVLSSTKLEIRAEEVLPGSGVGGGRRQRVRVEGRGEK
jgi:hypothetical protein